MPKGVYIRSVKCREQISKTNKRLGIKPPSQLGKHHSVKTKKKLSEIFKGHLTSDETRRRISKTNKGRKGGMEGKYHSKETKEKISNSCKGSNNPNWKGGATSFYKQKRNNFIWKKIIKKIYKRDNYTCQLCGKRGRRLEAHHVIPWRVEHNDKMNNLITLCNSCHHKVEKRWWQYAPIFFEILGVYKTANEEMLFK